MNRSFYFDNNRRSQGDNGQSNRKSFSPYNSPNQGQGGSDQGFRGFQGRNRFRQSFPQNPYSKSYSPNSPQNNFKGRNSQKFSSRRDNSIEQYFHPSMLEDPWAGLLGNLEKQKQEAENDEKTLEEDSLTGKLSQGEERQSDDTEDAQESQESESLEEGAENAENDENFEKISEEK
uniref:Uncharacterized protein n=1 Tax=Phlebotomus papatasi TaxID=29031 RepID=A0A1B0DAJ3_PHLPP